MHDYYCAVCNKIIKLKNENKHLTTKSHNDFSMCVVNKYCVKDPRFYKTQKILSKHVIDYGKKFQSFKIIFAWKLLFMEGVFIFKSDKINILRVTNYLKKLIFLENVDIDSVIYLK